MKAIDITLLFQACNFFIVYFVLRQFVFVPAMKIIVKKDTEEQSLRNAIDKALNQKQQAENQKSSKWLSIKKSLHALIPHLSSKLFKVHFADAYKQQKKEDSGTLSDQKKQKMKKVICNTLMDVKL